MVPRLLGAVLLALATSAAAQPETGPGFDLFVFVRSYSPTFCKLEKCTVTPISAFTIHGLWPEFNTGRWPQFCGASNSSAGGGGGDSGAGCGGGDSGAGGGGGDSGAGGGGGDSGTDVAAALMTERAAGSPAGRDRHLLGRQVADNIADTAESKLVQEGGQHAATTLGQWKWRHSHKKHHGKGKHGGGGDKGGGSGAGPVDPADEPSEQQKCEWPSFMGPDRSFWDHEWEKHGTCAEPVTGDRAAFFNATLRLHEQYDLDAALSRAGVEPSNNAAYPTRDLEAAVAAAYGAKPMLSCWHGQLLELWLCVGLDLKVQDCPPGVLKAQRVTCGATVSLPAGNPVPAECRPFIPPWGNANAGGQDHMGVRLATGAAVAVATAAVAALFVGAAVRKQRRRQQHALLDESAEPYDPLLRFFGSQVHK